MKPFVLALAAMLLPMAVQEKDPDSVAGTHLEQSAVSYAELDDGSTGPQRFSQTRRRRMDSLLRAG